MRLVCSYCHVTIRDERRGRSDLVSHGMCQPCSDHFKRLWEGMGLGEYLDDLPGPVLLVDAEGRVLAANGKAAALAGREPSELRGLLGGEAMACSHSRLPGGCGKTIHCRDCTVRRTFEEVARTGRAAAPTPAFLQRDSARIPIAVSARPVGPLVEVTVVVGEPSP